MLDWFFNRAGDAAQDAAKELAFTAAAVLLACGAMLFFCAGLALWLSTVMALQYALFVTAALLGVFAVVTLALSHHERAAKPNKGLEPLGALAPAVEKAASAIPASLGIAASSLVAAQMRKAPLSTLGVIAAIAAFASLSGDAAEDAI